MAKTKSYTPNRGDVVMVSFSPQAAHEQAGTRPALVLSPASYNLLTGLAYCCPITRARRDHPFEVGLPKGMKISGSVLVELLRSLAWRERKATFVETAPREIVAEVAGKLIAIVGGED
jgi:mRNA interferase MazF